VGKGYKTREVDIVLGYDSSTRWCWSFCDSVEGSLRQCSVEIGVVDGGVCCVQIW